MHAASDEHFKVWNFEAGQAAAALRLAVPAAGELN
jgi:hypothetical protein